MPGPAFAFAPAALAIQGLTAAAGTLQRSLANAGGQLTETQTSVAGFAGTITQASAAMAELSRRATTLNVGVSELHTFAQTAEVFAGLNFDKSFDALNTFSERVGEAYSDAGSKAAEAFRSLKVEVADDNGVRRVTDVWQDYLKALRELPAEVRNFEAAKFGTSVSALSVPLAIAGDEVAEYAEKHSRVAAIDEELAKKSAANHQLFSLLGHALDATADNALNWLATLGILEVGVEGATETVGGLNRALFDTASTNASAGIESDMDDLIEKRTELAKRLRTTVDLPKLVTTIFGWENRDEFLEDLAEINAAIDDLERRNKSRPDRPAAAAVDEVTAPERRPAPALPPPSNALEAELERARLATANVGRSARAAEIAELQLRLSQTTNEVDQQRLQMIIEETNARYDALAATATQARTDSQIANIRSHIVALAGNEHDQLLASLGITEQELQANEQLRTLFQQLLELRRKAADEHEKDVKLGEPDAIDVEIQGQKMGRDCPDRDASDQKPAPPPKLVEENEIRDALRGAAKSGLKDGFRQFVDGGDLGDIFDEIGRRLRDTILNRALDNLFDNLLDDLLPDVGGFFKGLLFGGAKASGGPVSPGSFYLVGEEGPELFAPRLPGAIIPNGMAFGGGSQTIAPVVHISGTVRSDADIQAIADRAAERSAAAVARAVRSGRLTEAA